MTLKTGTRCELTVIAKAIKPDGMTMDELDQRLRNIGNTIVRREPDGIVIAQQKQTAYEMNTP